MKRRLRILSALLCLALLLSLSVSAFALEGAEEEKLLSFRLVDEQGQPLAGSETQPLPLEAFTAEKQSYPLRGEAVEGYRFVEARIDGRRATELYYWLDAQDGSRRFSFLSPDEEHPEGVEVTEIVEPLVDYVYALDSGEHSHVWDEGKVTKEPGCEEKGEMTYSCACGEKRTEEIDALDHDWGEVVYTWSEDNSSCTAARSCKRDAGHADPQSETVKPDESVTREASCTAAGEKTLTAAFSGEGHDTQVKTLEIPMLKHEYAHGRCKLCKEIDPDFQPRISDDTKGRASWGTNYIFRSDAAYQDFERVLVDDKELSTDWYTVTEKDGSTQVTVKGDTIKKLKVGKHSFTIQSVTGSASISVSVSDKPKTGDAGDLWFGLLCLSALCGGLVVAYGKHRTMGNS